MAIKIAAKPIAKLRGLSLHKSKYAIRIADVKPDFPRYLRPACEDGTQSINPGRSSVWQSGRLRRQAAGFSFASEELCITHTFFEALLPVDATSDHVKMQMFDYEGTTTAIPNLRGMVRLGVWFIRSNLKRVWRRYVASGF
jgi:hypothetical protein